MKFNFNNSQLDEQTLKNLIDENKLIVKNTISLPFELDFFDINEKLDNFLKEIDSSNLKLFVLIGIGGSNLGAEAIINFLGNNSGIDFIVFDTFSKTKINLLHEKLKNINEKEQVLVNIVSKSGTTLETIVNSSIVFNAMEKKFKNISDRVIVTTDADSKLWEFAVSKKFHVLEIPKTLGGRFSVFSNVGLFPLKILKINVSKILSGASDAVKDSKLENFKNYALISALIHYHHYKLNRKITNNFLFAPELETLGKWLRQLIAESLGKKYNISGEMQRSGITPLFSIGTTDLHSLQQLFVGGLDDKLHNFIYVDNLNNIKFDLGDFSSLVGEISTQKLSEVRQAIYNGVKDSFKNNNIPFLEIEFENKNIEYDLGYFMQSKMFEIFFLSKFLNVNAFDQPEVEDYKKRTKVNLDK
ncbi:MAG: glucose-6-phosphate isomerase [Candidatus Dojkabacteria bacterium]|nr:MAG: glucose-6-phosphate isomerase [Candidatus Dojkabacteria bacterium]